MIQCLVEFFQSRRRELKRRDAENAELKKTVSELKMLMERMSEKQSGEARL